MSTYDDDRNRPAREMFDRRIGTLGLQEQYLKDPLFHAQCKMLKTFMNHVEHVVRDELDDLDQQHVILTRIVDGLISPFDSYHAAARMLQMQLDTDKLKDSSFG